MPIKEEGAKPGVLRHTHHAEKSLGRVVPTSEKTGDTQQCLPQPALPNQHTRMTHSAEKNNQDNTAHKHTHKGDRDKRDSLQHSNGMHTRGY